MTRSSVAFVAMLTGVFAFALPDRARADGPTANECIKASEDGLALRDRGKLRDARRSFVTCASDSCPKALRIDCARWLEDVDGSLPTVVFGAKDGRGADLFDVTVLVDGDRVVGHEQGKALPLDPGPHTIRFERKDRKPVEERVLLRAGERNRPIIAQFGDPPADKGDKGDKGDKSDKGDKGDKGDKTPPKSDGNVPILAYVLGAVGVAGLGSFTFFALNGASEKDRLRTQCSPTCSDQQVSTLKTDFIIADVSLGVGIVALGVATYLFLTSSSGSPSSGSSRTSYDHQRFARTIWK